MHMDRFRGSRAEVLCPAALPLNRYMYVQDTQLLEASVSLSVKWGQLNHSLTVGRSFKMEIKSPKCFAECLAHIGNIILSFLCTMVILFFIYSSITKILIDS